MTHDHAQAHNAIALAERACDDCRREYALEPSEETATQWIMAQRWAIECRRRLDAMTAPPIRCSCGAHWRDAGEMRSNTLHVGWQVIPAWGDAPEERLELVTCPLCLSTRVVPDSIPPTLRDAGLPPGGSGIRSVTSGAQIQEETL
jgi:hypothetical protein